MTRVINISGVLGTTDTLEGTCEVCTSGHADYDDAAGRLIVRLESYLLATNSSAVEKHVPAKWLPKATTVVEKVAFNQTAEAARNIFHRWVWKVRQEAPSFHGMEI